jgi:hypothetical protein
MLTFNSFSKFKGVKPRIYFIKGQKYSFQRFLRLHPEVGKVTLKSKDNEVLSEESP